MCGIAGIINKNEKNIEKKDLERMVKIMKYRGPDDEGYFIENNIGLGHCRLSIIDLSQAGHQPMTNENNNLHITYNGEIYNYLELKNELKKFGHKFKSNSDTEVILHAYEQWGEKCLDKFNGAWAFAIWNRRKKELFCSRDRLGIKPFYYFSNKKIFTFSSEIKSLLELNIKRKPNETLIYDFLKFGLLDHTNETFFKDIKKLPPASYLKIKSNGEIFIKNYWDFNISDKINGNGRFFQKINYNFLNLFIDSIKLRLRSDVSIGSCLSGGLDSSSIVCVVNNLLKKQNIPNIGKIQKTFSSCFKIKRFDERKYIEEVIKKTNVEKNYIFPQPDDFLKSIKNLLWHQEEPFGGTGVYAQWLVIKKAKEKKVKVLLDGQGGDELLAGYRKFYIFYIIKLFKNKHYLKFFLEAILFFFSFSTLKTMNIKNGFRYFNFSRKTQEIDTLLKNNFKKAYSNRKINFGYQKNLGNRLKDDLTKFSLPVLLRYADKNASGQGVEDRLPLLDYRLIEEISSLPLNQKMNLGWDKVILRNAMKNFLPKKIRLRKSKLGFATPEEIWLKNNLKNHVKSVIKNSIFLKNYTDIEKLIKYSNKILSKKRRISTKLLFRFYILELWGKIFILNYEK